MKAKSFMESLGEATFYNDANYCPYFSVEELGKRYPRRYTKADKALIMLEDLERLGILKSKLMQVCINPDGTADYARFFRFNGVDKLPRTYPTDSERTETDES
jgi:hypothetical protein